MKILKFSLISLTALTSFCCTEIEPEVHLLPQGFEGPVLIIFDQQDGSPPRYEGGVRVLKIPPDGILRTQFKNENGWYPAGYPEYYYITPGGKRTKVENGNPRDSTDTTKVYVYGQSSGISGDQRFGAYVVARYPNLSKISLYEQRLQDSVLRGFSWSRQIQKLDSLD